MGKHETGYAQDRIGISIGLRRGRSNLSPSKSNCAARKRARVAASPPCLKRCHCRRSSDEFSKRYGAIPASTPRTSAQWCGRTILTVVRRIAKFCTFMFIN